MPHYPARKVRSAFDTGSGCTVITLLLTPVYRTTAADSLLIITSLTLIVDVDIPWGKIKSCEEGPGDLFFFDDLRARSGVGK